MKTGEMSFPNICSLRVSTVPTAELPGLQELLGFVPEKTLLVDDTEKVLQVADAFGLGHLIHIARSSSQRPACYSVQYPSIDYFKELTG